MEADTTRSDIVDQKSKGIFSGLVNFKPSDLLLKGFIKMLKSVDTVEPYDKFIRDSRVKTLSVDTHHCKQLRPSLRVLKLKTLFSQRQQNTQLSLRQISRMDRLERLEVKMIDYRKLLRIQSEFSQVLERFSQLKEIDLSLRFIMEREDLFNKGDNSNRDIDPDLLLWRKITGIHIGDDEIPIEKIMYHSQNFKALQELSYFGEPKLEEDFRSFRYLSGLPCLRKVYLSISMLVAFGNVSKTFFDIDFLPPSVEELSLVLEIQRITGIIDKAVESGVFFKNIERLNVIRYFLLSINVEGNDSNKQDFHSLPLFFRQTVKSLSPNLSELMVMMSGSQKLFTTEDVENTERMSLMDLVCDKLPNLRNFYVKFPSMNVDHIKTSEPILQRLHFLSLEGPLPSSLIERLDENKLEQLDCQVNTRVSFKDLVTFLNTISRFRYIQTLNITVKVLSDSASTKMQEINEGLFCAIVNLFKSFERVNDLTLRIYKVYIGRAAAEYFLELCEFKRVLRFALIQFENCEITKEYFLSSISEDAFFESVDEM